MIRVSAGNRNHGGPSEGKQQHHPTSVVAVEAALAAVPPAPTSAAAPVARPPRARHCAAARSHPARQRSPGSCEGASSNYRGYRPSVGIPAPAARHSGPGHVEGTFRPASAREATIDLAVVEPRLPAGWRQLEALRSVPLGSAVFFESVPAHGVPFTARAPRLTFRCVPRKESAPNERGESVFDSGEPRTPWFRPRLSALLALRSEGAGPRQRHGFRSGLVPPGPKNAGVTKKSRPRAGGESP